MIKIIPIPKSVKIGRELAQKRGSTMQEKAAYADQLIKDGQEMANRIFKSISNNPHCSICQREVAFLCEDTNNCPNFFHRD